MEDEGDPTVALFAPFGLNPKVATALRVWMQYIRLPVVLSTTATPSSLARLGNEEDEGNPTVTFFGIDLTAAAVTRE